MSGPELRRGGPTKCISPCLECGPSHHYDPPVVTAEEEPGHEAARMGVEAWWQCEHCPGWMEYKAVPW